MFAFYPNKQITTGEGGLIVTDDDQAAALMRALRNQGRAPGDTWLQHTHLGYNYRLDEMSAALGRVQMSRLDELLAKREQVADWYNQRLAEIPGVEPPLSGRPYHARHLVRLRGALRPGHRPRRGSPRRWASAASRRGHISCPSTCSRIWWSALATRRAISRSPRTWGGRGLALPFSGVMSEEQVDRVCHTLAGVL